MDPGLYRDAMSRYAAHVQVVTTAHAGERRGVTITAACSVSDNPATVLVCLNNTNAKNEIFFRSGIFALNTLAPEQQIVADAFSGRSALTADERFAAAPFDTLVTGAPVLVDALAAFDCRVIDIKQTSTHNVLFGEVMAVRYSDAKGALLYLHRDYHVIQAADMDNAAIEEMFQTLGPVTIKRMFGGKGIYHLGLIIAVDFHDEILLKADARSAPEFEAAGCSQWTYEGKKGNAVKMPYWSIPDDAFDDPDIMGKWVRLAYEAALRAE